MKHFTEISTPSFCFCFWLCEGGVQLYKISKEGMKDQEASNLNTKPRHTLMMEEMQARMEKMEEDLHIIRLDDEDSILCAIGLGS